MASVPTPAGTHESTTPAAAVNFDLRNMYIEVKDVSLRWKLFGVALGIEYTDIEKIHRTCTNRGESVDECLMELLRHWEKCDVRASWEALLEALENTPGQAILAKKVRKKIFPGGTCIVAKPVTCERTMKWEKELQEKFAKTMATLLSILSHLPLNVSEVAMFISNLPFFNDSSGHTLIKDEHPQLEEAKTITKLWWIVNRYCHGIQDYYLPRCLVEAYGSMEAKQVMNEYVNAVEMFNSFTCVRDYASACEVDDRQAIPAEGCLVFAKVAYPYRTLKDACLVIQRGFNALPYTLPLCGGHCSSVWLHWAVAKAVVPRLQRVAYEKKQFFIENGIFAMEIGSVKIFEASSEDLSPSIPLPPHSSKPLRDLCKQGLTDAVKQRIHALSKEELEEVLFRETDTHKRSLLHLACSAGHTEIALELMSAAAARADELLWKVDTSSRTAMHDACTKQHLELVKQLFQHGQYTVPLEANKVHSLLNDAMRGPNQALALSIAREIVSNSKGNPVLLFNERASFGNLEISGSSLQETLPVFVMGDSRAGKSTLIQSLQVESYKKQILHLLTHIKNVDTHRAGIIPTHFDSRRFGRMVFFDLAGHREYADDAILEYGYLENALFIIVVSLKDEIVEIVRQLKYWLKFIRYHHSKSRSSENLKPSVIVIGSHLHSMKLGRAGNAERFRYAYNQAVTGETYFKFVTKVAMDCRNSTLLLVQLRWTMYYEMWELRGRCAAHPLPSGCYILYAILKELCTKQKGYAITIDQLAQELSLKARPEYQLIDHTVESLLSLAQPLHMLNVVLLLKDSKDPGKRWVVIDCKPLLSDIEQAIFGKDGRKISTEKLPPIPEAGDEAIRAEQNAVSSYVYDELRRIFDETKSFCITISQLVGVPLLPDAPKLTEQQVDTACKELHKQGAVQYVSNLHSPWKSEIKLIIDPDGYSLDSRDSGISGAHSSMETLSSLSIASSRKVLSSHVIASSRETISSLESNQASPGKSRIKPVSEPDGYSLVSSDAGFSEAHSSMETLDEYARDQEISEEREPGDGGEVVGYHSGVLSQEEIVVCFHQLKSRVHVNDQLMLKLMLHFKFCHSIHLEGFDRKKDCYFFPHLLPNPKHLREHFGKWRRNGRHMLAWVFFPDKDKGSHEFFMPHMTHQLLLEMSKFAAGHCNSQMLHTLWWIDDKKGVQVVLNVHNSQAIVLNTRPTRRGSDMECLKQRNILAERIRTFLREMYRGKQTNVHESLIPCDQRWVIFPVLNPTTTGVRFCDMHDVKHAVLNQSPTIGTTKYSVTDLLLFEPYHLIPKDVRVPLKKGSKQSTPVSANVFSDLTRSMDATQLGYTIELVQDVAGGGIDRLTVDEMKNKSLLSKRVEGLGLSFSQLQQALDSISVVKLQDLV